MLIISLILSLFFMFQLIEIFLFDTVDQNILCLHGNRCLIHQNVRTQLCIHDLGLSTTYLSMVSNWYVDKYLQSFLITTKTLHFLVPFLRGKLSMSVKMYGKFLWLSLSKTERETQNKTAQVVRNQKLSITKTCAEPQLIKLSLVCHATLSSAPAKEIKDSRSFLLQKSTQTETGVRSGTTWLKTGF